MAQIEINKEELYSAISAFEAAISTYENATDKYICAVSNLDVQNSDFVNQMKSMAEDISKLASKELTKELNNYLDDVKKVVDEFARKDDELAKEIKNNSY